MSVSPLDQAGGPSSCKVSVATGCGGVGWRGAFGGTLCASCTRDGLLFVFFDMRVVGKGRLEMPPAATVFGITHEYVDVADDQVLTHRFSGCPRIPTRLWTRARRRDDSRVSRTILPRRHDHILVRLWPSVMMSVVLFWLRVLGRGAVHCVISEFRIGVRWGRAVENAMLRRLHHMCAHVCGFALSMAKRDHVCTQLVEALLGDKGTLQQPMNRRRYMA